MLRQVACKNFTLRCDALNVHLRMITGSGEASRRSNMGFAPEEGRPTRRLDRRKEVRNISENESVIHPSDQLQERGVKDDSQVHSSIRHLLCAFSVVGCLPGPGRGHGESYG